MSETRPGDPDDATPTWSVAELATHLGRLLVGAFPDDVWVAGQIRNLSRAANGHVYFQLAEPSPGDQAPSAQLSVTLLAPERELVNRQLVRAGGRVRMTDGVEVRIRGRLRWFAPRGTLQLRMHAIDPAFTLGRLQEDRDRLLAALAAEGLVDRNARLPMPLVPLRLGLITSRGSAAHADVLAELEASGIGFEVRFVDARTQGPECPGSVSRALAVLATEGVELVLLVRGGGSRTDLAGFDAEQVARAIAASPVPVLTGIGHEIDRSVADEVAHLAHKTPTAAAGSVVEQVRRFARSVDDRARSLRRAIERSTEVAEHRLEARQRRAASASSWSLRRADQHLDAVAPRVARSSASAIERSARRLATVEARISSHDPQIALARGWSITATTDGRIVRHAADAPPGTVLVTRLADGEVRSTVLADDADQEPIA